MKTPEQKALDHLVDAISDSRFNPAHFANLVRKESFGTQERLFNLILSILRAWANDWNNDIHDRTPSSVARAASILHHAATRYL